jgi:hypothetical protein
VKSSNKDINLLIRLAIAQGWSVVQRRNAHLKWIAPTGFVYFSAFTPSDNRAIKNIRADLKRAGLRVDDSPGF